MIDTKILDDVIREIPRMTLRLVAEDPFIYLQSGGPNTILQTIRERYKTALNRYNPSL